MGEILFLSHRIPFPPDRGDKIRSHHLLKGLAKLGPVHAGTFAETDGDRAQEPELAGISKSHLLADRKKPLPLAGIEALITGKPVSLTAFDSTPLRDWVHRTLAENPIDTIFVFSGQMGQYVPDSFAGRVIIDLCDVDSAKFEQYAAGGNRVWLNRREGRLLSLEEGRLARRADTVLLISAEETALLRSRIGSNGGRDIRPLGNGIDAAFFDPETVSPHTEFDAEAANFVFTGQMDYAPNVAAVRNFVDSILPLIRSAKPIRFHIVGRAPTDAVLGLARHPAVTVWGEVPDVRPFLAASSAVVAPLTIARGVQNKVLEAMAMARAVVLTPEAATGIGADDGRHFLIGNDAAAFARSLEQLLENSTLAQSIGQAARSFVVGRMSWDAVHRELAGIVGKGEGAINAA